MISKYACWGSRLSLYMCVFVRVCLGGTTTKELIKGAVGVREV